MTKRLQAGPWPVPFFVADRTENVMQGDVLRPFAEEEVFCRETGKGIKPAFAHLWRHEKAFVLGLRDRRLPCAAEAMARLADQGYSAAVRHSGGAAVPLDAGVVNVSLILPKQPGEMDFAKHFEIMYDLLRQTMLRFSVPVHKGEISGSYCPGSYDLSIGGRKFCGIAQRRQLRALIVQAFVIVEGSGRERAQLVRDFYNTAACGQTEEHPHIVPSVMTSLQEECGIGAAEFVSAVNESLFAMGGFTADWNSFSLDPMEIEQSINELREAYDKR